MTPTKIGASANYPEVLQAINFTIAITLNQYVSLSRNERIGNELKNFLSARPISDTFIQNYSKRVFDWKAYFKDEPLIRCNDGSPDYLSSIFYMLNCVQEYGNFIPDRYGRFPYEASYQKHFGVVRENLVQHYIEALLAPFDPEQKDFLKVSKKSRIVLTHDIDSLFGSFPQDWASTLKKGNINSFLHLVFSQLTQLKNRPIWNTIEDILEIEEEFGFSSIFFWLPVKGRSPMDRQIKNADYHITSDEVRRLMQIIKEKGSVNGLHKSASHYTFNEEFHLLPPDSYSPINRFHFLRFSVKEDFPVLDRCVKQDYSLGFAEEIGFRNSYGKPFQPFGVLSNRPFRFIEVPLNIMDRTLRNYKRLSPEEAAEEAISFIKKQRTDAVISILWHNQFFTPYKFNGWRDAYRKILEYCKSENLEHLMPDDIQKEYSINFDSF